MTSRFVRAACSLVSRATWRPSPSAAWRRRQFQTYRARIAAAAAALSAHDVAAAARHLDAAPEELRDWEWRHLYNRLDDSFSVMPLPAQEAGLLFDVPDGLRAWAWSSSGLRLKYLETGAERALPVGDHRRAVNVMQTRRGLRVVALAGNSTLDLLDSAGRVVCSVEMPEGEWPCLSVSPDGTRLSVDPDGGFASGFATLKPLRAALSHRCQQQRPR
jgi:hypothetical protein